MTALLLRKRSPYLGALLVLLVLAVLSVAGCRGSGHGGLAAVVFVYDENGSVIPDAQVEVSASSPELALKAKTGTAGTVAFTGLSEDEFRTIAGLDAGSAQPEYKVSKDEYVILSTRVSGGDYAADNLRRGGRVHIEITLLQSEVDDPNWTPRRPFANADLHAVAFADSKRGWVAGSGGSVFYTGDGGLSWMPQASGSSATLTGLYLGGVSEVWGVASGAALVRATADGNWTAVQTAEPVASIGRIALSQDGAIWAIGPRGILRSSDGGITWSLSFDPSTLGPGRVDLTDIAFRAADEGWVTGTASNGETGIVLHTQDGGLTWSKLEAADCPLLAVGPVGPGNAWVTGCDVYRAEGDKLTEVAKMPKVFDYYDVAATGFGEAWVLARAVSTSDAMEVGPTAAEVSLASVFHTEDGGDTWDVQYRSDAAVLNSIAITGDGRGWIVGDEGLVLSLKRTSKGATPTPTPTP